MNERRKRMADLERQIAEAEKRIEPLRHELRQLQDETARERVGVNAGDVIEVDHGTVLSQDRNMKRRYKVTFVGSKHGSADYHQVRGRQIKRDGSLGEEKDIWQRFTKVEG